MISSPVLSMVLWDTRFQIRYGFWTVYAVLTVVYILALGQLPTNTVEPGVVLVIIADTAVLGFYFIGSLVLIEKREGVLNALVVSPLNVRGYLVSKVVSLSVLAVVMSLIIAVAVHPGTNFLLLTVGVGLTSVFFVLLGFIAVARFDSINEYFFSATLYGGFLYAPMLGYFDLYYTEAFYVLPVQPSLVLIDGSVTGIKAWELVYALAYLSLGILVTFFIARREFKRHIIEGTGKKRRRKGGNGRITRWFRERTGSVGGMVLTDLLNWSRNPILLLAAIGPLMLSVVARFGLPFVDQRYLTDVSLVEYYPLMLGFLVLFPPYIYGMVVGFLILEDKEQRTLDALRVTPLTGRGYLVYRGATAYLVSLILIFPTAGLFGLFSIPLSLLVPVALVTSLGGPTVSFLFASLADDSIEGVVINKFLGLLIVAPVAGILILPEPLEYVTGVLPFYWPIKALMIGVSDGFSLVFISVLGVGIVSMVTGIYVFVRLFSSS